MMDTDISVAHRSIPLSNVLGLHLRPASLFVGSARRFQSDILVCCKGIIANGKSVLSLLSLAAECGSVLALEARGEDADDAVAELADLVASRFHESEREQRA